MLGKTTKISLAFFLVVVFAGSIFPYKGYAVPAAPFLHTLTQSDGTMINARQWGDESRHGWETDDGYTIVFDEGINSWAYATHNVHGELMSSSKIVGRDSPPDGCFPHIRPTGQARLNIIMRMTTKEILARASQGKGYHIEGEVAQKVVPSTGTANIPVILINFSDTSTAYTKTDFNTILFGTGNHSMNDYYKEVSYGKFSVSAGPSGVVGWYTASKTHDYYGQNKNNKQGDDVWPGDLVYEAVQAADAAVDFAAYDMDGDGYVDAVNIVHQGKDEASGGNNTDIWSHRWTLSSAKYYGQSHYDEYTTNDKNSKGQYVKVNDYTIEAEKSYNGTQETVGVFAHEYGHALGLPDLYDTDNSSEGIGDWSLMAGGSYNSVIKSGDSPAHLDAWCKYSLGWVTPTQVSGTLTNETITQAATTADVYKLLSGSPLSGEYFLVENRQKTGFDTGLPGSGLLIWHIDGNTITSKSLKNEINDSECYPPLSCSTDHYGVALVQADGQWSLEKNINRGDAGDPYSGSNNASFSDNSYPNSKLYNGNKSNVSITNISTSGSTMTATMSVTGTTIPTPTTTPTQTPTATKTPTPTPTATPSTVGNIAGAVVNAALGSPIAGATVSTNTGGFTATTGAGGTYAISNVTPGSYTLTASRTGFVSVTQTVAVTAGVTTTANFGLVPVATPTPTSAPTPSPTATPTSTDCGEYNFFSATTSYLDIKRNENKNVTVTTSEGTVTENDVAIIKCYVEGMTVTAVVNNKGKKLISVSPTSAVTDENGDATFTIKAKNKKGKAKVSFSVEEWSSWATLKVSVKVR